MLVFLDESFENNPVGGIRHAYAGFGIGEQEYRGLVVALHQCKLQRFRHSEGMNSADIALARSTHIITKDPPDRAEIKAASLLSRKQAIHHSVHGDAPGILMAEDILHGLSRSESTVFGVLSQSITPNDINNSTQLPLQISRLLERVELWMREMHPDQSAIIVPDSVHVGINRSLSAQVADFLFKSPVGRRMNHIVPNPFWVDSSTTAGSQCADLIAHILLDSMRPQSERKQLTHLWRKVVAMEFRSQDGATRGIRKIRQT